MLVAGCGTLPLAQSSPTQSPIADALALRDQAGRIVPHTHVMPSRWSPLRRLPNAVPDVAELRYHNGSVQRLPTIYVVFWGFHSDGDPAGEATRLTDFLNAVGASSWLNTVTQYYQNGPVHIANPSGQLKGTWFDDTDPVPAHPTDKQIRAEAVKLAQHFSIYSVSAAYIVATPTGHNTAGFPKQWCSYHGDTSAGGAQIPYTNLPYMSDGGQWCGANAVNGGVSGRLDGVTIVGGHELAETQTDPGNGGWWDAKGNEIGDKCAWLHLRNTSFGSFGSFPTQPLWSNSVSGCVQ